MRTRGGIPFDLSKGSYWLKAPYLDVKPLTTMGSIVTLSPKKNNFLMIGYIFMFNYSSNTYLGTSNIRVSRNMKVKNISHDWLILVILFDWFNDEKISRDKHIWVWKIETSLTQLNWKYMLIRIIKTMNQIISLKTEIWVAKKIFFFLNQQMLLNFIPARSEVWTKQDTNGAAYRQYTITTKQSPWR